MDNQKVYIKVKDHSVSGEEFELRINATFDMLETHPKPGPDQLGKYYQSEDYISHTDAKRNLFERVYHFVRSFTLRRKLNLINSEGNGVGNLLDIGCGTGDFLELALRNNWRVKGVEPNNNARAIANAKTNDAVISTSRFDQLKLHSFDVITLWHVLEHLPDLENEIRRLNQLLKPTGKLVIAVPNFKSFDASYYKSNWAAYDTPRHLWHFSQGSIKRLFEEEGFVLNKILPMKLDAYYVSLLSEKIKSGWMNLFNAFFVATRSNLKASRSGEYSSLIYVLQKAENAL